LNFGAAGLITRVLLIACFKAAFFPRLARHHNTGAVTEHLILSRFACPEFTRAPICATMFCAKHYCAVFNPGLPAGKPHKNKQLPADSAGDF